MSQTHDCWDRYLQSSDGARYRILTKAIVGWRGEPEPSEVNRQARLVATLESVIPALHLSIREGQVAAGENTFSNIGESQKDLANIYEHYLSMGGAFFVVTAQAVVADRLAGRQPRDSQVIGFAGLQRAGDLAYVKRVAVVPQWRRRGIATDLLHAITQWSDLNDIRQLRLSTGAGEQARPIYESVGFRLRRAAPDHHNDWLMERITPMEVSRDDR